MGEGLGLGNHIAISTGGVIIWQGVENGHNTGNRSKTLCTGVSLNVPHSYSAALPVKINQICSCGSVVEHCVSSAKGHGFNSQGTHILIKNV